MHDNAGSAMLTGGAERLSADGPRPSGPKLRKVAATAMPIASSVMTVNAPLATDFSARSSVIRTMTAKNPAAINVSHIGNAGVRQN